MFGIKHIKFDSMTYVLHFKNGNIKREGRGLSFFYFAPNSSIAAIPMGSNDLPFIFNESTNDYQTVNIQGQISYKISNPKTLADVLDFTVNDNGQYKKNDIEKLLIHPSNFEFHSNYHFGGYAKTQPELIQFIADFASSTGILLDPVYTGKMMFAIFDLATKDYFPPRSRILAIHTGGLFGLLGMKDKFQTIRP